MKHTVIFQALIALTLMLSATFSQSSTYREGVDYEVLDTQGNIEKPGKIEVREFFWFGCPHCYSLEAALEPWRKTLADDVNFVMTPPPMNPNWTNQSHAFYVAEALDKLDAIKPKLFHAIHVEKNDLKSQKELAEFFTQFGVDKERFNKMFDSFSIRVKVRQAIALAKTYRLSSVPALVINGKYLIKPQSGKSHQDMLNVADFLIEKERLAAKGASLKKAGNNQ